MYGVAHNCQNSDFVTYTPSKSNVTAVQGTPYLTCRLWNTPTHFDDESLIMTAINGSSLINPFNNKVSVTSAFNTTTSSFNNYANGHHIVNFSSADVNNNVGAITEYYVLGASNQSISNFEGKSFISHYFSSIDSSGDQDLLYSSTLDSLYAYSGSNIRPLYMYPFINSIDAKPNFVHLLSTSVNIDGFYYPLVYMHYNSGNTRGNGLAVVQNSVLNDVGFVINGVDHPITTSSAQMVLPDGWVVGADSPIAYEQIKISGAKGVVPIINNIVFYLSGGGVNNITSNATLNNQGEGTSYHYWNNDQLHLEYKYHAS